MMTALQIQVLKVCPTLQKQCFCVVDVLTALRELGLSTPLEGTSTEL